MLSVLVLFVLGLGIGGIIWFRQRRWHRGGTTLVSVATSRETLASQAFAHGNKRLAAGQFDAARAAFQHVLVLNPKHSQVVGRLAALARQRHAERRG